MDKLKDPLIVSAIFFAVSSEWFDTWVKDMFPTVRDSSPLMIGLIKTAIFAGLYWLYNTYVKK